MADSHSIQAERSGKAPAFQWYPKDCLTDPVVVAMSLEAEGAYRRLIDFCWLEGSLPEDTRQLAALAKAKGAKHLAQLWSQFGQKFVQREDGRWVHPRLEAERTKQAESRLRRQRAAEERWKKEQAAHEQSTCNADAMQCPPSPSSSASPTPVSTETRGGGVDRFARFWDAYPKKRDKGHAETAFKALHVSDALLEIMLAALAVQRSSPGWRKDGGQFIPNAATWLRGKRWDDEVETDHSASRAAGPSYSSQDWFADCQHEPRCDTGPAHRQRLALEAAKREATA